MSEDLAPLQQLRVQLAACPDLELILVLTKLEDEVRKQDREDAVVGKRRGRVKWLAMGDVVVHQT